MALSLSWFRLRSDRQKCIDVPVARCKPMRTFSITVRLGKVAEIWNDRTMPRRAT